MMRPLNLFLFLFALSFAAASAQQMSKGYTPRPCGFDFNDNGLIGEPADCRVCNGIDTDPDNDGVFEDLIYVDCNAGSDTSTCGSPSNPCGSIDYAFNTRADGHGDGAEDIVCFSGSCPLGGLSIPVRGVPGHRVAPATGSESRAFQYPTNPAMLVGWDSDGDGQYPPFDTDDVAELDGTGLVRAFRMNNFKVNSHFELAHFSARNYNANSQGNGGFMKVNQGKTSSHLYVHDLELANINRNGNAVSGQSVFDLFSSRGLTYFALENVKAVNTGSYFTRGSADYSLPGAGPFRYQNLTITADGCDAPCSSGSSRFTVGKFWGWFDGFEFLDSEFDCNVGGWNAGTCRGIVVAQCSQDVVARNNTFTNFTVSLDVQGSAGGSCSTRPVDDVVFDRNMVIDNTSNWDALHVDIRHGGSADSNTESVHDVAVTNNIFWSSDGYGSCFHYFAGNKNQPQQGTMTFANNTCHGDLARQGFGAIDLEDVQTFNHQDFFVKNNVISGLDSSSDLLVDFQYLPNLLELDYNAYDPIGRYRQPTSLNITDWRNHTGLDPNSRTCIPTYVDAANGDLHLATSDNCAQGNGINLYPLWSVDFDGIPRPASGAWTIGASGIGPIFGDNFEDPSLTGWSLVVN